MSVIAGAQIRQKNPLAVLGGDIPAVLYSDPAFGGDGKSRLNPAKPTAKWLWLSAEFNGTTPMTLPASAQKKMSLTIKPTGDNEEGDFEAATILAKSAAADGSFVRTAIQPYVNTKTINRFFSNQPISAPMISGVSQLPGALLAATYCLPKTSWQFTVQSLDAVNSASFSLALYGRQFSNCSPCDREELRKHAEHLRWFHPYWIGPQDPSQPLYTGPEVTLAPGATATLTFPIPSSADFVMFGALDDSTSSGGGEPSLYAQMYLNDTKRGLVDLPSTSTAAANASQLGISWRDFLAIPTVTGVTGFPQNKINAFSLAPNLGGWTHLVPRNTQVVIQFISTETVNTITLRPSLFGLLVYGRQPADRFLSADGLAHRERLAQAREFLRRMEVPVELVDRFASGKGVGGKAWQ